MEELYNAVESDRTKLDVICGDMRNCMDSYHKGLMTNDEFDHSMGIYEKALFNLTVNAIANWNRVAHPIHAVND